MDNSLKSTKVNDVYRFSWDCLTWECVSFTPLHIFTAHNLKRWWHMDRYRNRGRGPRICQESMDYNNKWITIKWSVWWEMIECLDAVKLRWTGFEDNKSKYMYISNGTKLLPMLICKGKNGRNKQTKNTMEWMRYKCSSLFLSESLIAKLMALRRRISISQGIEAFSYIYLI